MGSPGAGGAGAPIPPIETPRLMIRALSAGDVPALTALWTDPEVTRHMGGPRDAARVQQVYDEELVAPPRRCTCSRR